MLTFASLLPAGRPLRRVALTAAVLVGAAACKDFTSVDASFANVTALNAFYAINGAPPGAATAINLFSGVAQQSRQRVAARRFI